MPGLDLTCDPPTSVSQGTVTRRTLPRLCFLASSELSICSHSCVASELAATAITIYVRTSNSSDNRVVKNDGLGSRHLSSETWLPTLDFRVPVCKPIHCDTDLRAMSTITRADVQEAQLNPAHTKCSTNVNCYCNRLCSAHSV